MNTPVNSYTETALKMTPALDRATMTKGLQELGVLVPEDFAAIQRSPIEKAQELLLALKEKVKQNFRRLSKELHPDINGGDALKTERFKMLAIVKGEVDKMGVQAAPPPPIRVMWRSPFQTMNVTGGGASMGVTFRIIRF